MKYYSELTKSLYDSEEELKIAEEKINAEKEQKEKDLKELQEFWDAMNKAKEEYEKAEISFYNKKREYVKKYGECYLTYSTSIEGNNFDIMDYFFHFDSNSSTDK